MSLRHRVGWSSLIKLDGIPWASESAEKMVSASSPADGAHIWAHRHACFFQRETQMDDCFF